MNGAVIEGGQVFYVRTDHIGLPVFATDAQGVKAWEASYLPFGGVHTSSGDLINLRFPGQRFQSESGLHQNWMRDYDPTLGRYVQADPLGVVDGANVYGYALQNPGRYMDPRGEQTAQNPNRGGNFSVHPQQPLWNAQYNQVVTQINYQYVRLNLPPFSTVLPRSGPNARTIRNLQAHLGYLQAQPAPSGAMLMCRGSTEVYAARGIRGELIYFGITNQTIPVRQQQHGSRFDIRELPGLSGLSRPMARGVEQALIMHHGGAGGRGQLLNVYNSISPWNPNFVPLVTQGNQLLMQHGY